LILKENKIVEILFHLLVTNGRNSGKNYQALPPDRLYFQNDGFSASQQISAFPRTLPFLAQNLNRPKQLHNALNSLDKKLFLQFELTNCQPMRYLSRYSETSNAKLLKGKPPCFDMI
jgi:hypothetical protein